MSLEHPAPAEEIREQLASLISYLRDLHALRNPPLRTVAGHGGFRLDARRLEGLPGVRFEPSGDVWLSAELLVPPMEPALPADLLDVAIPRLVHGERPVAHPDAGEPAASRLESWCTAEWDVWRRTMDQHEVSRRLYLDLFAARDQIEADSSGFELVWGFGFVRWSEGDLSHPLFTVGLEIDYRADEARLDVRPSRSLRAETEVLTGLPLVAQRQLFEAMTEIENKGVDPWQHELGPDVLSPLVRMMSHTPAAQGGPDLQIGEWVIFARRRPSGYESFVRGLESKLEVLASLPTLASLVASDPRQFDVRGESGDPGIDRMPGSLSDVLLPLPSNDEQRAILHHARQAPGVTVEGPPGTGKSHTIANLISGFMSEGKRVLVTAERAQALEVLLAKIPDSLRALCVPVLGVGQEDRMRLEHSIDRISEAAFGLAEHQERAARLPHELDALARTIAENRNRLREARHVEALPVPRFVPVPESSSRAELADWLHRHESELSYIPDPLSVDAALPWTADECRRLEEILARINPEDLGRACDLVDRIDLPPRDELERLDRDRQMWLAVADDAQSSGTPIEETRLDADEQLTEVKRQLSAATVRLKDWEDGPLLAVLGAMSEGAQQQLWRAFSRDLSAAVAEAYSLRAMLQAYDVALPMDGPLQPAWRQLIVEAAAAVEGGGRLGFAHRRARQLLEGCRVNGRAAMSAGEVRLVLAESDLRAQRVFIRNLVRGQSEALGLRDDGGPAIEDLAAPVATHLSQMVDWLDVRWPELRAALAGIGVHSGSLASSTTLADLLNAVDARLAASRVASLDSARQSLVEQIRARRDAASTTRALWQQLLDAIADGELLLWDATIGEVARLWEMRPAALEAAELIERASSASPRWADVLRRDGRAAMGTAGSVASAWAWRKAETWFRSSEVADEAEALERELQRLLRVQQALVGDLAATRAWLSVIDRIDGPTQVALAAYKTVNARMGKGYSKFMATFRAQLDEALRGCRHVIPAWVMPVERVLTDFSCEDGAPFDVLIIDEASQLPMTRLPIFALAHKVIVVGDDKQISPSAPGLQLGPAIDAMKGRLDGIPNSGATYFVSASVYDVAVQRYPRKVQLREHFRCLTPIIEFSNSRYYDGRLVPLRDRMPTADWKPLNSVLVRDGVRDGQDCNRPEAERIAELIAELVDRPEYATRTFGVITLLGRGQSNLIHDLVFDALGPVKMAAHAVRVGEAALFQGDERDVVFISTVVADTGGKSIGAMTAKPYQQMVNVAASRARDQLWVVHSVPADAFPAGDERAALIRHCSAVLSSDESYEMLVDKTDQQSPFERALLRRMLERGYRTIRPQHQVGRYRIDFVVDGPSSRLAIECDGDRFHGPEQWDADRARQEVLERAGWTFVRIRGSAFYRDPMRALEPLWAKLDELGIPAYDWTIRPPQTAIGSTSPVPFEPPTGPPVSVGLDGLLRVASVAPASQDSRARAADRPAAQETLHISDPGDAKVLDSAPQERRLPVEPLVEDPWAAAFRAAEQRIKEDRASGGDA